MVVKVYISGISGNKEVKKRQQRVLMILDSKNIKYDVIDITEPGRESDKEFMQSNSKANGGTVSDPNPRSPLPPQVFNDDEYCGDYDQFDMANEVDTLEQFLKVEVPPEVTPQPENGQVQNGDVKSKTHSKENSQERDSASGDKAASKEGTPSGDKVASKEGTPLADTSIKEGTPVKDETDVKIVEKELEVKEAVADKESSPERQLIEEVVEKSETTEAQSKQSKENTPVKTEDNENGPVSSREHSVEKTVEQVKEVTADNPSEALIQSEQAAATD